MQSTTLRYPERALCSELSPSMANLNNAYGEGMAETWLIPQLTRVSEYTGCKDKLNDIQIRDLALTISSAYPYLKASELMLFFAKFKAGEYGEFYGAVDPMKIMSALRKFIAWRSQQLTKLQQEQQKRQREEDLKGTITREEWERIKAMEVKQ